MKPPEDAPPLPADLASVVRRALNEDLGPGDLTAGLLPDNGTRQATVLVREAAILCGCAWFDETFKQLDERVEINWRVRDGAALAPDQIVCALSGPAQTLLSGERTALNFLQLLSGTATLVRQHADALKGAKTRLLDTRKTLPGLRSAQRYAVACGGGSNHRMGLYDAILLKENHIHAIGSVAHAVSQAKSLRRRIEIEVENEAELLDAIRAGADVVLLDNFSLPQIRRAVQLSKGRVLLEVSGNVEKDSLAAIAATGVDFISVGALTKNVRAIDFSLRLEES